ncbi:MAG: peptidylprolyl isomerase [Endomicrobia bacterium]|nr:peptidylprolyl isomerase [Endomicrobiia bacterium]MDW8055272.1 peptidylprolyl isomerase [Elusimicrobiota bacterium]
MNKKIWLFLSTFCLTFSFLDSAVVDKVIVKINDENIMKSEFDKLYNSALEQYKQLADRALTDEEITQLKQRVLDQLIADKLLLQEARKRGIKVTKRELEEGIKTVKSRFPTDQAFMQELKKENLTEKQFQKRIEEQLMVLKLVDEIIRKNVKQPTEKEAKEVFDRIVRIIDKKEDIKTLSPEEQEELRLLSRLVERYFDEQVRVRHILIRVERNYTEKQKEEARKKILEIKKKLDDGEDFVTLAQKFSEDPGSKDRGGDLGFIARGDTVKEFEKVAFSLKEGQTSDIVETEYGYHIIRVVEKKPKRKPDFDLIKEDLLQYVARKNAEKAYEELVEELKKKAKIQYLEKIK